ncbi:uncharacterized protein [Watersipora subatra]|uniref:uncharacterized protein n=1 Tax=Watersipora subatra TaxID=2589382 RepID=UPI00355C46FD
MSETTPVVFHKDYSSRPYTPAHSARRPSGFIVCQEQAETVGLCGRKTPITKLEISHSISNLEKEQIYQDLEKRVPEISKESKEVELPLKGSEKVDKEKVSPLIESKLVDESSQAIGTEVQRKKNLSKFPLKSTAKPLSKIKTPSLPANVRAHIVRQCTMPSYAVLHEPEANSREAEESAPGVKAVAVERFTDTKERGKNLTKPAYQPFTKRNLVKSTPTITPNGLSGSKTFLSITVPKEALTNFKNNIIKGDNSHSRNKQGRPPPKVTPKNLQRPLMESSKLCNGQSNALTVSRGNSITLSQKRLSVTSRKSSRSSAQGRLTLGLPASHVDVNIPTAIPASNAASSHSFSYSEDSFGQSWDLDDVRSGSSDVALSPLPCPPSAEKEDIKAMKERIHRELVNTLSATEQFLQTLEYKRQHKPPQLLYSDDEEPLPKELAHSYVEDFVNAGVPAELEAADNGSHGSNSCNNSVSADVNLHDSHDQLSEPELSLSTDMSA